MAAPTYDNSASTSSAANVASLTTASWTIAGSDRYLVAGVCSGAGTPVDPTNCKWGGSGGTDLTKFGSTLNIAAFWKASLFGLVAPTAQSSTLYCSWPSNQDETALLGVSANGVDQTTSTGTLATATGVQADTVTVAVTTVADDFVVDLIWVGDGSQTYTLTVGANQTSRQEIEGTTIGAEAAGMSTEVATGVSTTMDWTASNGGFGFDWGLLAIGLKPTAGGGGGDAQMGGQIKANPIRPRPFAPGLAR